MSVSPRAKAMQLIAHIVICGANHCRFEVQIALRTGKSSGALVKASPMPLGTRQFFDSGWLFPGTGCQRVLCMSLAAFFPLGRCQFKGINTLGGLDPRPVVVGCHSVAALPSASMHKMRCMGTTTISGEV